MSLRRFVNSDFLKQGISLYSSELEGEILELVSSRTELVKRKYCYLGGNVVHIVSQEKEQHVHLKQNTRVLTSKALLD